MKTIKDATLSDFKTFFLTDMSGVSCRPYFERWLSRKAIDENLKEYEASLDRWGKANAEWRKCMEQTLKVDGLDAKLEWMRKGEKFKAIAEKEEKLQRKLEKEQDSL